MTPQDILAGFLFDMMVLRCKKDSGGSMLTRLEPPIPMNTVKGDGYAFAVIDYGFEADLVWVVALDESREIWCVPNGEVRMQKNWTAGRRG